MRKTMSIARIAAIFAAFCGFAASAAAQQDKPAEKDAAERPTRIAAGDKAPAFTLADQNGKPTSLDGLLEKGPVALVFYRSADW